jgi:hypothetical protein
MRTFNDAAGTEWTVWMVRPSVSVDGTSPPGSLLSEDAADGWLAFESKQGRRRFYQCPPDWLQLTDQQLAILCAHAAPVVRAE